MTYDKRELAPLNGAHLTRSLVRPHTRLLKHTDLLASSFAFLLSTWTMASTQRKASMSVTMVHLTTNSLFTLDELITISLFNHDGEGPEKRSDFVVENKINGIRCLGIHINLLPCPALPCPALPCLALPWTKVAGFASKRSSSTLD
jgi:hypothetical protein